MIVAVSERSEQAASEARAPNIYMSLFGRLRLAITSERQDIEVVEEMVKKDEDDLGAKG